MSDGIYLAANVFVDRLNEQGQSMGQIIGPINTTKLSIKAEAESKPRISNKKASKGQALDDIKIAKPAAIGWEFDDQPAELVAMALMGEVQTINEASGTLTDKPVTLPANNSWVAVGHNNFASEGLVVSQAATELVMGTDYEFNYALGLIRALPGGAVDGGGSITVTGQYNAVSGKRIRGGTKSQTRLRLFGEGENLTNGKRMKFDIYDASMMPSSEMDLSGSDYVSGALEGTAKLPPGKNEPYVVDELTDS
ncbi:hypothetical protein [Pseudoalteromonas ruthenica]|uniref:phage tail tube protein n=1 Tax=Pseudoalteromonas ruthenica TaxID=151081 RepID=UPI0003458A29|nr:hypothetical protein [Pseudoalteromonas ruthenica]